MIFAAGLYKWQMRALEHAARGERLALRAANGSGKTDKGGGDFGVVVFVEVSEGENADYFRILEAGEESAVAGVI